MKALLTYTAARLLVLVVLAVALFAVGLRGLVLAAVAIILSLPVSYVLLRPLRDSLSDEVERRVETHKEKREELRAQLRDEPAVED